MIFIMCGIFRSLSRRRRGLSRRRRGRVATRRIAVAVCRRVSWVSRAIFFLSKPRHVLGHPSEGGVPCDALLFLCRPLEEWRTLRCPLLGEGSMVLSR